MKNMKNMKYNIIKKIKGTELVGLKYESPFDNLSGVKKTLGKYEHEVIATDEMILPISEEEGTGMVHVAPGAGTEDFQLAKKLGLPVIELIDEEATYISDLGEFSGKNAKEHPETILDFLKDKEEGKYLFDITPYTHRYPACWRCKTELVWRVVDEWYISMDGSVSKSKSTLRKTMMEVTRKIRWIPDFGLERELDWLKNMRDWLISKKRYWGLALPIWECKKCGNFEVIGSREELRKKVIEGWDKFKGHTPHKPWIDEVKIKCFRCGEITERIPDVGNPWLDAGIVSFSTISKDNKSTPFYISDRKEFEKWFPADFITESFPGQFKNWFYSLLAMSTVLEDREPFKNVLGFALACDVGGNIMHKSNPKTYISFNDAAEKAGSDVMRWIFTKQNPRYNLLFGWELTDQTRRRFHLTLWNIYNFFVTYANLDGWTPKPARGVSIKNLLDGWAMARLRETIIGVTESLDKYDAQTASSLIEDFVSDLSLWYIRRSRGRVGLAASDKQDKQDFYEISYLILVNLAKILAPFTPFLADMLFTNLVKPGFPVSVHLVDWPDKVFLKNLQGLLGEKMEVKKLMKYMKLVRSVVEKGHSARKEAELPVRQPLNSITVYFDERCDARMMKLIEDELNVKEVIWKKGKELKAKLNTKITPELEEEAKTRELIRKIQEERKGMGIGLTQKIKVKTPWIPESKNLIQKIKKVTLTLNLEIGNFEVKVSS